MQDSRGQAPVRLCTRSHRLGAQGKHAQVVPGAFNLLGIACPSATTCEAVGTSPGTPSHGVVVPIVNGTPGSVQVVPSAQSLTGAACQSVTTCEAVARWHEKAR